MYQYINFVWKFNWINDNSSDSYIDGIKIKVESNILDESDYFYVISHEQIQEYSQSSDYSQVIEILDNIKYNINDKYSSCKRINMNIINRAKQDFVNELKNKGFYNES